MTTRILSDEHDRAAALTWLGGLSLPLTLNVTKGKDRSQQQNRLAFKLYKEIADHFGDRTPEDVRTQCKLEQGIPILRHECEPFRITYDNYLKPLSYHAKIEFIERMDMGVTRLMTVKQFKQYLDTIYRRYSELGVNLTVPESEHP